MLGGTNIMEPLQAMAWRQIARYTFVAMLLLAPFSADVQAFQLFDALIYSNKPDLAKHGLSPFKVIYESDIWASNDSKALPDLKRIAAVAKRLDPGVPVAVDIEHWPTRGKPEVVKENIDKYKQAIKAFRQALPATKIGYYSIIPVNDYWRAIKTVNGQRAYDEWLRENIKLKEIADYVDYVYPSLYTFYADQKGWEKYAIENLKEAKKYGKPVYAFLWPEYHDSNTALKDTNIPAEFWRFQLETCYRHADGIVIWGGWQKQWDESAPWWLETKKFLQSIKER